jgi:signal transduction histidine kinase
MKGDSWRGEVEIKTKSDRIVPISLRADAIKDKTGKIIGVVCICNDITKRKHAESQLKQQATQLEQTVRELQQTQSHLIQTEKLSSLGQLVAGVAHEINNPVSFIHGNLPHVWDYAEDLLGLVTLYQQEYPNPTPEILDEIEAIDLNFIRSDLPKMLSSIKVGTQRICEIVRSLRNFSRLDEAMMKGVDLHEGIDSTLMILHNRLRASPDHPGIQVIKEYGKLPLVECYAGPLNQVFMNLIGNAIDALEELVASRQLSIVDGKIADNPQIRIHTEVIEKDKVSIRIYDNGSGMPESVRKRLFDPFFTTKAVGKGTGLGLSISHSIIVQKHGGNLSCISAPGEGTEFIIEIPIHQPNQEPPHVLDETEI